jgi:hypothetical protein
MSQPVSYYFLSSSKKHTHCNAKDYQQCTNPRQEQPAIQIPTSQTLVCRCGATCRCTTTNTARHRSLGTRSINRTETRHNTRIYTLTPPFLRQGILQILFNPDCALARSVLLTQVPKHSLASAAFLRHAQASSCSPVPQTAPMQLLAHFGSEEKFCP